MKKTPGTLKIVTAAMIGHILEFFDFTIYAVFATELGKAFFPATSPIAQLLGSLAILAVGFFMRPVGGALFGHIGDKYGRRIALTVSVLGMAFATITMALLPTYQTLGIAATALLVMFRLVQGICVGGEGAGASIFVLEHLHNLKPGLIGGIVNASLTIGILLAVGTGYVLHSYIPNDPNIWRYAFIIGGVVGIAGLYIRLNVDETPVFKQVQASHKVLELPIKTVLTKNMRGVLLTVAAGAITSTSAYMVMTFIDMFYRTIMNFEPSDSLRYSIYGNIILVIGLPIAGHLSDTFGYIKTMLIGALTSIMLSVPIFIMMASPDVSINYFAITLLSLLGAIVYAPLYPFILSLFTPEQRYSGIACSLNIGIALFGGTSSMACITLFKMTELVYAPAFYMSFTCLLFIVAVFSLCKRRDLRMNFKNMVSAQATTNS